MSKKYQAINGSNEHKNDREQDRSSIADCYRSILKSVGEDPNREGLLKTPERAAQALIFFTKGYQESLSGV
jgi:GTP cyclohydrolase I